MRKKPRKQTALLRHSSCLETALELTRRNIPIVLCKNKKPLYPQQNWHNERLTVETIRLAFKTDPDLQVAIVLGPASGLIDIECDSSDAETDFAKLWDGCAYSETPVFLSQRGAHRLFAWDERFNKIGKSVVKIGACEIRLGAGGKAAMSVIPPSSNTDGTSRLWIIPFDELEPAPLPDLVVERILNAGRGKANASGDGKSVHAVKNWQQLAKGVPEGKRNESMAWLVGKLLGNANMLDDPNIALLRSAIQKWNERNEPPLDSGEVDRTFDSILSRELEKRASKYKLTDCGNAERFAARHASDVRFCHPMGKWLVWDGTRWRFDVTGEIERRTKETVRHIYEEATAASDADERKSIAKWAHSSEAAYRISAVTKLSGSESGIPVLPDELDADHWVLNVSNGTLDLRSGELRPHQRSDLITKLAPVEYDQEAKCPTWLEFLNTIFESNQNLIDYVQRLLGYCLTGNVSEQVLPILFGVGANGKSTLLGVVLEMFGDYGMKAPPDLLLARRGDAHPTERADLAGKRFVAATETGEGRRMAESMVKELTGSDRIRARRMREDFWEFSPTHKILIATNHKPFIRGTDHAIWRRIQLIPFDVTIADDDQDKNLPAKLCDEFPGVLAWCVQGCLDWQQSGLRPPDNVHIATNQYRVEQDVLAAFMAECCVEGDGKNVRAGELYDIYKEWCGRTGERTLSMMKFGQAIGGREIKKNKSNGIWYQGIEAKHTPLKRALRNTGTPRNPFSH